MRPPMRSSIACLRCRKSKIKCDNDNTGAACDTCIKSGHKCEFPDPVPLPPKRPEPPTSLKQEKEVGHERKRAKKLDDVTLFDSQRSAAYAEEILSAQYLTGELWDQVFGIYKLHFATELPFLHLPTLKEKMTRQLKDQNKMAPEVNLVLLGILALTARFHSDLVKYVAHMSYDKVGGPRSRGAHPRPDPGAASEFFANALTTALGPLKTSMTVATVERVQAFLMLGLYEWSQARQHGGLGAWMYVGVAIRMAQALKLGFGDKPGRGAQAQLPAAGGKPAQSSSEMGITREIKRRTMFSCLILDRMLACGKERVSTIRSEDLQIQLPCTEMAFDLALDVYTGFLSAADNKRDLRTINDDSVLSRFVQLVDIWGEISKYSFSGGRLVEKEPPWQDTTFKRLRERLDDFYDNLPETFTLSTSNYYRHDNHQATSMFVSLHMLGSVCQIMLHREYIPFIPIRCDKPEGPLDEPVFSQDIVPGDFWAASAEQVFKAARDIVELIEMCREKLPHSSLVLFAIWTAAFVGIYARHFPHMDANNHMVSKEEIEERGSKADVDITLTGSTSVTFHTLNRMAQYFSMASSYVTYFKDMDKYFTRVHSDYLRHVGKNRFLTGQSGEGKLSIRLGGDGGGLEEWRVKGDKITNNGSILDEDRHQNYDGSDRSRASTLERSSSNGPENSLSNNSLSDKAKTPRSTPSFTAINNRGQQQLGALPESSTDTRPGGLHGVGNRYPYGSQPQHSPTQSYPMGTGPPLNEGNVDRPSDFNIEHYMNNHQYLRFGSVLNDVQEFAGGSSVLHPVMFDGFPDDISRSSFFGQAADGILLPQFVEYDV